MTTILKNLLTAIQQNRRADIFTLINAPISYSDCVGQMVVLYPGGLSEGMIINEDITHAIIEYVNGHEWAGPSQIDIREYAVRVFWNRSEQKSKAIIAGGGHISLPLSQILSMAGFQVTVIDDRPEFANRARFPQAEQVFCEDFTRALSTIHIDRDTAVIIVTRGHRYDLDCLRAVINSSACYLGMIGSRRRIRSIIEQMIEEGMSENAVKRLYAPIGLDIGAQTPEEIAVSIAAEVIAVYRGGTCLPLSAKAVIEK